MVNGLLSLPASIIISTICLQYDGNFGRASLLKTFKLADAEPFHYIAISSGHGLRSCLECATLLVGKMRDLQGFGCGEHGSCFYLPRCLYLRNSSQARSGNSVQKLYVKSGLLKKSRNLTNLALGMPADQSSALRPDTYRTEYGNDGDFNTYFHCGRNDPAPWWRVDLGSVYCIESVNLTNRNDNEVALHRANNLLITVAEGVEGLFYTSDNTTAAENLCAFHEGELGEWAHIHCSSILQGKFVQVQNHLFEFHLSEVEVYGY